MYKICMVGTGYVGLVSGACFADFGNTVICVDKDLDKIARLQRGEIPFYEIGLDEIVERNVKEGRLSFSPDLASAVKTCDVIFIAVQTLMSRLLSFDTAVPEFVVPIIFFESLSQP